MTAETVLIENTPSESVASVSVFVCIFNEIFFSIMVHQPGTQMLISHGCRLNSWHINLLHILTGPSHSKRCEPEFCLLEARDKYSNENQIRRAVIVPIGHCIVWVEGTINIFQKSSILITGV